VKAALQRVEPPARAAWLAKWAIVLMLVPAFGFTLFAMGKLVTELGPPHNAVGILMPIVAMLGVFAAACILLAIPIGVWVGIVALLRLVLGGKVDRRARALRVALDHAPRPGGRGEVGFLRAATSRIPERYERLLAFSRKRSARIGAVVGLILVEIVMDLFGHDRTLDFGGPVEFAMTLGILLMVNGILLGFAVVPAFFCARLLGWALDYFMRPPSLFHFEAQPPVINDALLSRWTEGRDAIVGRAEPITEAERVALAGLGGRDGDHERVELEAPFSRARCLAYRVTGESQAQPLDDADVLPFTVVGEDGRRCVVFAADLVVLVPPRGEVYREGGKGFLEARGLDGGEVAAREGRLDAGDRVRATGRIERVAVAGVGMGYRAHGSVEVLVAGDGSPVVIEARDG
jgi:hypothetical protein